MISSDLHTRLKNRLELVREDLEQAISRIGEDMLGWAPREGMRTIRGQLLEIAATERQNLAWLQERKQLSFQEAEDFGGLENSLDGLKQALRDTRKETLDLIEGKSENELRAPIPMPERWFESLKLPEVPLEEVIRSIAAHEWYHTGQLVSYLWARGDDPYKW